MGPMSHAHWWSWLALVIALSAGALYWWLCARRSRGPSVTASHGGVVIGRDNSGTVITRNDAPRPGRTLEVITLAVGLGSLIVAVLAWLWPQS
jgi:hypothetical protein